MTKNLDGYALITCHHCGNSDTMVMRRGADTVIVCAKCHRIIVAARDCFSTDGQTYQRAIAGRAK